MASIYDIPETSKYDIQDTSSSPAVADSVFTNMVSQESGGHHLDASGNLLTSSAGAEGITQLMPATARDPGYGVTPIKDKSEQEYLRFGKDYFTAMLNEFKGDPEKAAAAYNAGPGAIKKAVVTHGDNWKDFIPKETQNYISSTVKASARLFPGASALAPKSKYDISVAPTQSKYDIQEGTKQSKYDIQDQQSDISAGGAFAKSALGSAGTAFAAAPAMALGSELGGTLGLAAAPFLGPAAPAGPIVGSIVGGITGFIGGQKLVDASFDALPNVLKESISYDKATRQAEREAHPDASFRGDLAGNLVLFRPGSLTDITLKSGKVITPNVQRAGMAAFGGGFEAGMQSLGDQPMDWQHVGEAAAFTGVAAKPTKYMDKLGGLWRSRNPVRDPGAESWTYTGEWVPPVHTADGIPIDIGPTGKTRADGTPIHATHERNEDGSSKRILIDLEGVKEQFKEQPWTNPKVEGVRPLAATAFKTPEEWAQFVLRHEQEHTTSPRNEGETQADYENRINSLALDAIRKNPYFNLADARVPPTPKSPQDLTDAVFNMKQNIEADASIGAKRMQAAMENDGLTFQEGDRIAKHFEGDPTIKLTPKEIEFRDKYFTRERKEAINKTNYLIEEGVLEGRKLTNEWFPRERILPEMSRWEKVKAGLAGGKFGGMDQAITAKPGAAQERTIFVGQRSNGRRLVLQEETLADGSTRVVQWKDKNKTILGKGSLKAGERLAGMDIVEARRGEIEQHSPYQYEKNAQGVLYKKLTELNELIRAHEFMKNFKKSDYFKDSAIKIEPGVELPPGWRAPKHIDRMPELAGYAFERRLAEAIEDVAKAWKPTALTTISGMLIKNMMLNPLAHMLNEAWHVYNARGLTGWVTPAGIYRFGRTGMPALRDVMQQSPFFRELLDNGASLLSADVRNSHFADSMFAKANKEFTSSPEGIALAKEFGMSPLKLYDAISKQSSIAMWTVRDMMYVQQIREQMMYNKLSMKEAIYEVERHLPAYRLPTRVGEGVLGEDMSRRLSEVLQNPNVTIFSRYHYGMLKSLMETAKDLSAIRKGKAGLPEFKHGVDTAAAIAVAIAFLYPLQDMIAQSLTGNEDAKQRRAGPYHIFHAIHGVLEGEKDPMAVLAGIFTFNPALLSGAELVFDRQLYNGQPIYHPQDDPEKIAYDIGKYMVTRIPQASQAIKANKYEEEGWDEMLARQADIENPPGEVVMKREKRKYMTQAAGERRSAKWWMED